MLMFPFIIACLISDPSDCRMLTVGETLVAPFAYTLPALPETDCLEAAETMADIMVESFPIFVVEAGCIEFAPGENT